MQDGSLHDSGRSTLLPLDLHRVMVLNPDHTPFTFPDYTVSWRRAVRMVMLGAAYELRYSPFMAHSPSVEMRVPSVIVLKQWYRAKGLQAGLYGTASFNLGNLFLRDRGRCMYTDVPVRLKAADPRHAATQDHVLPKSRGGPKTWLNSVLASGEANNRKGDRTPAEAGMRLKYDPWLPTCADLLTLKLSEENLANVPDDLLEFLVRVKPSKRVLRVLDMAA